MQVERENSGRRGCGEEWVAVLKSVGVKLGCFLKRMRRLDRSCGAFFFFFSFPLFLSCIYLVTDMWVFFFRFLQLLTCGRFQGFFIFQKVKNLRIEGLGFGGT